MGRNREEVVFKFNNQDFESTRDWCLRRGYLFEDPYFKMDNTYEWRRPPELTRDPRLFIGEYDRIDIIKGKLASTWVTAAITSLALHPDLLGKVIPEDQSFTSHYAGIFHFHFWRFGRWFDVVIDDRLPTENGELVCGRSPSKNEFWSALLEKALCKVVHERYQGRGLFHDSFMHLTGGVLLELFNTDDTPKNFLFVLINALNKRSLVGCETNSHHPLKISPEGLIRGNVYSIMDVKEVLHPKNAHLGKVALVQMRNANYLAKYTGPWSASSPEWTSLSESTKQEIGLVHENDGEFWMPLSNLLKYFDWLLMCHTSPEQFSSTGGRNNSNWHLNMIRGCWVKGVTAGGASDLYRNPQARFSLSKADDNDKPGLCPVIIGLLQEPKGGHPIHPNKFPQTGFKIFRVQDPSYYETILDENFLKKNSPIAELENPVEGTPVETRRLYLPPGGYCVIPFTYEAGREGKFLLTIYSRY